MNRRTFSRLVGLGALMLCASCGSAPTARIEIAPTRQKYDKKVREAFEKHEKGCGAVPMHQITFEPLRSNEKMKGVVHCNVCNFHLDIEVQRA